MPHKLLSLHHVTATVDDAQTDLNFCLQGLGLRLVKKTVNFDNHNVYHFYYGTERGEPGSIWTTFPYKGHGVRAGQHGAGQVTATAFSVPASAMGFWRAHLKTREVAVTDLPARFGEETIVCRDSSGLVFDLTGTDRDAREAWDAGPISSESAIRGLHHVTMTVRSAESSVAMMTAILGFQIVGEEGNRIRVALGGDRPGHLIDLLVDPAAETAVNGIGTVHHVAMAIGSDAEQAALRDDLLSKDYRVTDIRDRTYFRSIYFREPGGVLFEVATVQPGFTIDEDLDALGRDLKLPPWEEAERQAIESQLAEVTY